MEAGLYQIEINLDYTLCDGFKDPPMDWYEKGINDFVHAVILIVFIYFSIYLLSFWEVHEEYFYFNTQYTFYLY
jgi:hypothetical protein